MDRLWAVWRIKYVEIASKGVSECIFCSLQGERDDDALIIHRSRHSYILMNRYPYNPGHLMVAPYRHVSSPDMLNEEEAIDLWNSLLTSINVIKRVMNPDGFNIGMNLGRVAGAGFEGHIHVHVVPRWNGDTNFMPVISDTKVLGEALESTYRRLKEAMKSSSSC